MITSQMTVNDASGCGGCMPRVTAGLGGPIVSPNLGEREHCRVEPGAEPVGPAGKPVAIRGLRPYWLLQAGVSRACGPRPFQQSQLARRAWFTDTDTCAWLGGPRWPRLILDLAQRPLGEFSRQASVTYGQSNRHPTARTAGSHGPEETW